jgi:3-mercaptopyruvate sulfurtransferase SseA
MRLILSFLIFAVFGLVQQDCHKDKMTASKTETTQQQRADANTTAVNVATAPSATPFPEEAPRISLEEAKKDFDKGAAIFVDTRAESAFQTEHIKGAINIPAEAFQTRYAEVPKDKKIIAYCS